MEVHLCLSPDCRRIKGMHHYIHLTIECFKLEAGKRYLEHTVLEAFQVWDANKSCEVHTEELLYLIKTFGKSKIENLMKR